MAIEIPLVSGAADNTAGPAGSAGAPLVGPTPLTPPGEPPAGVSQGCPEKGGKKTRNGDVLGILKGSFGYIMGNMTYV